MATYYVNTASTGSGDGTTQATTGANAAWAAISEITGLSAGDSVLFNKGNTWRETLTIPSSGSAGSPITFGAYGTGASPIISGADLVATWSRYLATAIYSASCNWTAAQVFEDDTRLTYVTWDTDIATTAATMSAGTWTLDTTNDLVYVWATDELDPDTHTMEVSERNHCIYIDPRNYIAVENLTATKSNLYCVGLYGDTTHHITIDGLTISYAYEHGINGWDDDTAVEYIVVDNCTINYCGAHGIGMSSYCSNWTVKNNTVHNNCELEITSNQNYTAGIKAGTSNNSNILVEHNTVYSNGVGRTGDRGSGIWMDTIGAGVVVRYNECYSNNDRGIMIEVTDDAEVYYNKCYSNTNDDGIGLTRDCHGNKVYNNVCYGNAQGIGVIGDWPAQAGNMEDNLIKNNILSGNTTRELRCLLGGENDGTNGSGNVYEYNCLGAETANFIEWANGTYKSTYDAWEATYGSSTHSAEADPLFVDAANGNFHLRPNSPCLGIGRYPLEFPLERARYTFGIDFNLGRKRYKFESG